MEKELIFHAPPKSMGKYSHMIESVTVKEPKSKEEKNDILTLIKSLVSDDEIPYEEKMSYLFVLSQEIMSHSYGLFPKNFRNEE